MGNDGGVIAVRRKFMRHGQQTKKKEQTEQEQLVRKKVTTCALSEEPLQQPIVADALGNLFNKKALLERLLSKTLPKAFAHLSSLKQVTNCHFYAIDKNNNNSQQPPRIYPFHCPITMMEFNGKYPFVVLSPCGCVVSKKSVQEIKSTDCLVCNRPLDTTGMIELLPPPATLEKIRYKLAERRKTAKLLKKQHKKEKQQTDAVNGKKRQQVSSLTESEKKPAKKKSKTVTNALENVESVKEKSAVFASLFDKKEHKKNANDLLMTVAGMRYTLS